MNFQVKLTRLLGQNYKSSLDAFGMVLFEDLVCYSENLLTIPEFGR